MQGVSESDRLSGVAAVGRSDSTQIVAQQAAVAQIGQSALTQPSLAALFDEACALVSRVLETELVSISELAPDGRSLKVIAGIGWRPGLVGTQVLGALNDSQSGYTIETGGPVIVADLNAESRFNVPPILKEHGAVSGIAVRIGDAGRPFGVLAAFTGRRGRFTADDANFLQSIANVLAAAVERARVDDELRGSRDELSAIVAGIDEGITVQGADGRLIYANDIAAQLSGYDTGAELVAAPIKEVLARFDIVGEDGAPLPLELLPSRRALGGETVPPMLVEFRIRATGERRWSAVAATPVLDSDGRVRRVINTFRDVTDERWARESRSFIADAGAILSSTLDTREAALRLAELSVPRLADYCTVHMRNPDGTIANIALTHTNPERLAIARRLQELRPPNPDAPTGIAQVIRDGKPQLAQVTPAMIDAAAAAAAMTDEEIDLIRRLEMRSYLAVPLIGRSGPIGALALVMAESGRQLTDRELALAEELGARAGIALENAQLYQTAIDRRAQLDAVLGALAEGVLVFDSRGRLELSNPAAEQILSGNLPATSADFRARLGLENTNATGSDEVADDVASIEVQLADTGRWVDLRRYRASRAGARALGTDGEDPLPSVIVMRDITDARAARAARDAFMGVLSHELRTPITTIYGGSELLQRGLDAERQAEIMTDIRVEAERLTRLVEDLLVMTRVERGTVEIGEEPILVQRLLPAVVQAFGAQWPNARTTLIVTPRLPAVRGDPTYVEQVVRNLLTNAARYGRASETGVEITAEENEGEVVVRVLDRGPGFDGTATERLFELFYRAEAARSVPGGAGIGLFVCRHLIEAMGGRMWAKPRPDGGAEFGFSLAVVESDFAG